MTCLRGLSEPVVTSKLSGDLLTHLRAASEGHVKLYVVKCLLEEMPEQQYGNITQHNPVVENSRLNLCSNVKCHAMLNTTRVIQPDINASWIRHTRPPVTTSVKSNARHTANTHTLYVIHNLQYIPGQSSVLISDSGDHMFVLESGSSACSCLPAWAFPAETLKALIGLLAALAQHHAKNGMSAIMLGQALGPLLFRPGQDDRALSSGDVGSWVDSAVRNRMSVPQIATWHP